MIFDIDTEISLGAGGRDQRDVRLGLLNADYPFSSTYNPPSLNLPKLPSLNLPKLPSLFTKPPALNDIDTEISIRAGGRDPRDARLGLLNADTLIPNQTYTPPPGGTAAERAEAIRKEREREAARQTIERLNRNNPTMDKDYPFSSIYNPANGGYPVPVLPVEEDKNNNSYPGEKTVVKTPAVDKPSKKDEKPEKYSDEGLALSAEFFGALAARRRAADEALQMAMEQEKTQTERLNLAATTARTQLTREFRNLSEDMMRMLAGRGTARAPMVAGRGARRLQTAKDERFGQISQTLADEVSALGQMVQMAESAQRAELARIAQDEALAKTQPAGLLPASAAFGG